MTEVYGMRSQKDTAKPSANELVVYVVLGEFYRSTWATNSPARHRHKKYCSVCALDSSYNASGSERLKLERRERRSCKSNAIDANGGVRAARRAAQRIVKVGDQIKRI